MTSMSSAEAGDATPMVLVAVPDGTGGTRHEWRPQSAVPAKNKGRRERRTPDPIHANPEAAAQQLKQIIEQLERLMEERDGINDDIKDVKSHAKAIGFDRKGIDAIIALRNLDPSVRAENEAILETYKSALGLE